MLTTAKARRTQKGKKRSKKLKKKTHILFVGVKIYREGGNYTYIHRRGWLNIKENRRRGRVKVELEI